MLVLPKEYVGGIDILPTQISCSTIGLSSNNLSFLAFSPPKVNFSQNLRMSTSLGLGGGYKQVVMGSSIGFPLSELPKEP